MEHRQFENVAEEHYATKQLAEQGMKHNNRKWCNKLFYLDEPLIENNFRVEESMVMT